MTREESNKPAPCPGCGTSEHVPVERARTDRSGRREDLATRLASGPDHTGGGCTHLAEGIVIAGMAAAAGAYAADDRNLPWLTAVGAVAAVLILVATIAIVRGENRDARRVLAGAAWAAELTGDARYCPGCRGVFSASGSPWSQPVSPERFRLHVWTAAGYGDLLDAKAKAGEPPSP
ncbi:hypothetical protein ACQEVM_15720 [Streptomyces sp. CA-243310]|uniref:hypothetical protein n=1 Tax=Streptomyces sp. CA-243310 TaxID=3240056 RepID=UPI003D932411